MQWKRTGVLRNDTSLACLLKCTIRQHGKNKETTYWQFHRLLVGVEAQLQGSLSGGEPVGGDGYQRAHSHQSIGADPGEVMMNVVQLWNPKLHKGLRSLHNLWHWAFGDTKVWMMWLFLEIFYNLVTHACWWSTFVRLRSSSDVALSCRGNGEFLIILPGCILYFKFSVIAELWLKLGEADSGRNTTAVILHRLKELSALMKKALMFTHIWSFT